MTLSSLRDLQFELNKRKSAMMELDYKSGYELPTIRWTINEGDIIKRRREVDMKKLYRDAYLAWKGFYQESDIQRFGSSPVKGAYWSLYAPGPYVWKSHIKQSETMVFRRYPSLLPAEELLPTLVKALLGFPQPMGYKRGSNNVILNDAWTVNLRSTERENIMMDAFLKGFAGQAEDLKKAWEGKQVIGVDVSSELQDLYKVYTDAEEHLKSKEAQALEALEGYMKRYTEVKDERKKVTAKLSSLKQKLAAGQPCAGCDEDEDDEDEEE